MNYPFYFEATHGYWEASPKDEYVEKTESGFIYAKDFADAARIIEAYYGEELLSIDNLKVYGDYDLFILPVEAGRAAIAAYEEYKP